MSRTELERYLQDTPEVARLSAKTIAQMIVTMRLLIANEAKILPEEVSLELSFQSALEALKDFRKYNFQEYCREELERLKPIVEAERAEEERRNAEREARWNTTRSTSELDEQNDSTRSN